MKRARSTAYPVLDLATAYRILRQDLASLGTTELERGDIAKKLGYNDATGGLAARKVGALAHYGFLVRRGSRYGLSPLGLRLQRLDIDDAEFSSAIRNALENPTLFKAILDRYRSDGKVPDTLDEHLASLGITAKASADAAEIFRNSALFAGVLDVEGFFQHLPGAVSSPPSSKAETQKASLEEESEWAEFTLLLTKKRKAFLVLPRSFETTDYQVLKEAFAGLYKQLPNHLDIEILVSKQDTKGGNQPQETNPPLPFPKKKPRG